MEAFILVISKMEVLMVKEHSIIMFFNLMISNTIKVNGKMACQTGLDKHIIITETFIKGILLMVKEKVMDHMYLIRFIDMKDNGEITLFMEKENYSEMDNYFLKVTLRMD
jgi:hypothetical protein